MQADEAKKISHKIINVLPTQSNAALAILAIVYASVAETAGVSMTGSFEPIKAAFRQLKKKR